MVDYSKRVIIPMLNKQTDKIDFDLVLYGISWEEAMTVPCPAIHDLAERYPNHMSSPFFVTEFKDAQTDRRAELNNQFRVRADRQRYRGG